MPKNKNPDPAKSAASKKAYETRRVKAAAKASSKTTHANTSGLKNHVGVIAKILELLGSANPLSSDGWTCDEIAETVSKHFGRPFKGVRITTAAQISRGFGAGIAVKKVRENRHVRYSVSA